MIKRRANLSQLTNVVKRSLQTLEICLQKDMLLSKITPRLQTTEDGEIIMPENVIEEEKILHCCCGVPINKYSVFEGLTDKRLECSQA